MKHIFIVLSLFILGCSKNNSDNKLFLDFPSGIKKDEFMLLANKNPDLVIEDENFPEYKYEIFLKTSSVQTGLKPIFKLNTGKLYQIFIHGEAKSNSQLIELENLYLEKYKNPKSSLEQTSIRIPKVNCLTWTIESKEIRFCRDSFPDPSLKILSSLTDRLNGKSTIIDTTQSKFLYFFEISYTDKSIENEKLNEKTKKQL